MTATYSTSNHGRLTNRALIANALIGVVAALAAVGCGEAATAADDIESAAQRAAPAGSAAMDLPEVASDQPAFLDGASVQLANIDPAMLQPERQSEFPELAPLSPAEVAALLRIRPGPVTIDPAMLQPERQTEFPELAPLSPAEMAALLP